MDTQEFRTGALSLVQSVSDAVSRCLSGHGEAATTFSWVTSACRQLRVTARDDTTRHLVGLIDRAAGRLRASLGEPIRRTSAIDESDPSEIVLVTALWSLEDHLARLSRLQ